MGADAADEWWMLWRFVRGNRLVPIDPAVCIWTHPHRCPAPEVLARWEAAMQQAKYDGATRVSSVRYHPHPWVPTNPDGSKNYRAMRERAEAYGITLVQHLIVDSQGHLFPCRLQPQPYSPYALPS